MTGARRASEAVVVVDEPLTEGRLRWVVLDRPDQRNPLDHVTVTAVRDAVLDADADADVRVVALTGRGSAFSAGGDLKGYQELYADPARFRTFLGDFAELCRLLETGRFVSIAAINGTCVAGGLEVVLACDLVLAARGARIGDGHLRFGQLPGAGGSQRLVHAIGPVRARRWLLQGELYDADEAAADGLVGEVVGPEALPDRVREVADACGRHSPLAVSLMKKLVDVAQQQPLDEGLEVERELVARYATTSHDAREGLEAFAQHRPPRWLGT